MEKKNLLIVSDVFYPEDFVINHLVEEYITDYDIDVLTRNPSYPLGKIYDGYTNPLYTTTKFGQATIHRVHFIPCYRDSKLIKLINYFWNMLLACIWASFQKKKFDKVLIYQAGSLLFSYSGIIVGRLCKCRIVLWTTDIWPDTVYAYGFKEKGILESFLTKYVKNVYKYCSHIMCTSKGATQLVKKYTDNPISYIPNWSLLELETSSYSIKLSGNINISFAGNIGKVQNLENVISGFNNVSEGYPDVFLNIIGDGSNLDVIKELAKDNSQIRFFGRVKPSISAEYLRASDVLLLSLIDKPIFDITIPAKFQAYLQMAKPILAIMKGEVVNMVKEENLGWTAKPDDVNEISLKFVDILQLKKNEMAKIGKAGLTFHDTNFKKDLLVPNIKMILEGDEKNSDYRNKRVCR